LMVIKEVYESVQVFAAASDDPSRYMLCLLPVKHFKQEHFPCMMYHLSSARSTKRETQNLPQM